MLTKLTVIKNTFWLFSFNTLNALISFLSAGILSRNFSVENYGSLQLAITIFLLVQSLESLYSSVVIKNLYIKNIKDKDKLITNFSYLNTLFTAVILLFSAVYFLIERSELSIIIFILCLGQIFRVSNAISYIQDAKLESKVTQKYQFYSNFISQIFKIVFALLSTSVFLQAFTLNINYFLSYLLHTRTEKYSLRQYFSKIDWTYIKNILSLSFPVFLTTIPTFIIFKSDLLILGYFNMKEDVAIYANASKLSEPWLFIATAFAASCFPKIHELRKKSYSSYYLFCKKIILVLIIISFMLSLATLIFSDLIIHLLFSAKYAASSSILKIKIWSNIFIFIYYFITSMEIVENKTYFSLRKALLTATFTVFLNFLLIPKYGINGCAYISIASSFFLTIGSNIFFKTTRKYNSVILKSYTEIKSININIRTAIRKLKKNELEK